MPRRGGGGGNNNRTGTSAARTATGPWGTDAVRAVVAVTTALGRAARLRRTTGARTMTVGFSLQPGLDVDLCRSAGAMLRYASSSLSFWELGFTCEYVANL